ncbi:SAV_2336 N-terminal domain-related protein [Streptomyces sp. NPDC100445]|uniref:SAV_2336 N-terminal domain-related protein n=1 Tax=Streptomyces sp. NPDC100445 TaxID=3366102 RepID=UPI0038277F52
MSSDRAGSPDPVVRLADILAEAGRGVRPTPLELAELLWLAGRMSPDSTAGGTPGPPPAAPPAVPPPAAEQAPPSPQPPPAPPAPRTAPAADRDPAPAPACPVSRVPLHLPARRPAPAPAGRPHRTLMAPAPPMLRHPLALQRALRPLGRRTDAPVGLELDERATADRIARLGAAPEWWLPVLRPAQERWLRLNLVYDAGPTMPVWRPLIRELHTALAQSGTFRTVALHRAAADGTVRGAGAHAPGDGRTVTLLISDCMGPQWREGPAGSLWYATLHRWARRTPLAVVQPLPEHLWRDTALPAAPGRLSAPYPVAPSAALTFTPYDRDGHESVTAGRTVPLPVLEPAPSWLAHWAALLTAPGGGEVPGAVAELGRPLPVDAEDRTDVGALSAEELVLRFRATASPEAFRLAGHLAVGRPDLPVMRLVQAAVEPDPRPQHLAEIVLSGMLTAVPGGPPGTYAFRDGVRELLLLGLPRTARNSTAGLLERVGEFIDRRAGRAPGEFRASVPAGRGAGTAAEGEPFATVSADSVRRLSGAPAPLFAGRYRLLRRTGPDGPDSTDWLAEDTRRDDGTVLVRRYTYLPRELRAGFAGVAALLGGIRHPGIAAVTDHGVTDEGPYLVREFAPGRTLDRRLDSAPHGLPAAELTALLPPLAAAVNALHTQGRPHGRLTASDVVLTPRGPVLTCLDVRTFGGGSRADDLRALGHIVRAAHHGPAPGRRLPPPPDHLLLPERIEAELDTAVAELLSDRPETQQRGADRLRRLPGLRDHTSRAGDAAGTGAGGPAPAGRSGIRFSADALGGRPEARITLEAAVHEVLARGSLTPRQYAVDVHPDGYLVRTGPDARLLPALVAVLRELPQALARLTDPPRLMVTFGEPPVRPPEAAADAVVVVPPALYDDFAASSAARRSPAFRPLFYDSAPDSPPAAWYCLLGPRSSEPGERDLVRGPFITADLHELGVPTPGRTAVVHTRPGGPLTLLDPIQPYGTRAPRPETYYTVDLTPHEARHLVSLPSSGKGAFKAAVKLSWRVEDPVALVRAEATGVPALLLAHLTAAAAPLTRPHPLRRAGAAQRAVNAGIDGWPVPGLAVSYTVQLVPEWAPAPEAEPPVPSRRRLSALLTDAETVLIGFDGPLARLFPAQRAREAVLDLLSVVADHRDPQDALTGRPLPLAGPVGREAFTHPLDLLRAFAHDRLGPLLRARLDDLELRAVPDAPTTHRSLALVRALHRSGRRVSVVTDVSTPAVHRYLEPSRLPLAGVHGRRADLGLLTPHPDCLLRALRARGTPARGGVLISSSVAELTAAQQLGLRFVGYAPTAAGRRRLREEGSEVTVSSLEPLLEAARSL